MSAFFKTNLGRIVLSFIKAFGASMIVLAPGILWAPDFNAARAALIAAVIASLDTAFKAMQIAIQS